MADIFQINYEQMEQITAMFKAAAEATEELRGHVQGSFDPLESGDWRGEGFSAFADKMGSDLFPALGRLQGVLTDAAGLSAEVAKLIRAAEEEAADVFEGESEGFLDSVGDFFSGAGDAIGDFFSGAGEAFGNFWKGAGEWVHGGLDVLGFIPGFGEVADGINGLIYLAEGRHLEAGISFAAMIPIVGDAGKVGKYGVKLGKEIVEEVVEEGAEKVVKEVAEEAVEEGAEKAVKEGVQEGGEAAAEQTAKKIPDSLKGKHYKEVEIVDSKGSPLGEFDQIKDGVIIEDKAAEGLSRVNPRTGLPAQTADQWAEKQIFKKTQVRIDNLEKATSSRPTANGSPDVPSLEDIKTIRDIRFHMNGDTPELRAAVQKQMERLKQQYPDWNFDAEFGL